MCIKRYGRYWAVYASDGALICLCVYRKGALEVVKRIQHALDDAQQWQYGNGPTAARKGNTVSCGLF